MPAGEERDQLSQRAAEMVKVARAELGDMSARRRLEGFAAVEAARMEKARPRVARGLVIALTIVVGAVAFLTGRFGLRGHAVPLLSYAVEQGQVSDAGVIEGAPASGSTMRFSDGTEVALSSGARAVVRSVDEHGARLALTGKADVRVVRWPGAHWLIEAGPFLITVKGTAFSADWRESEELLEVVLRSGSVAVSGPLSDEAIALRAGQRLVISARQKEAIIRDIAAEGDQVVVAPLSSAKVVDDSEDPPSSSVDLPFRERHGRKGGRSTSPAPPVPSARSWSAELAGGRFDTILQQAEQRGIDVTLAEGSSDDLAALADAARYRRRDDLARRTLMSERRRFPGTSHAHDAAFLLGRLEETAGHAEQALVWYEQCLKEMPHATYTAEALGRKMTVVERLYGRERAKPVAEAYLRRFGDGTYAAAARVIAQGR